MKNCKFFLEFQASSNKDYFNQLVPQLSQKISIIFHVFLQYFRKERKKTPCNHIETSQLICSACFYMTAKVGPKLKLSVILKVKTTGCS